MSCERDPHLCMCASAAKKRPQSTPPMLSHHPLPHSSESAPSSVRYTVWPREKYIARVGSALALPRRSPPVHRTINVNSAGVCTWRHRASGGCGAFCRSCETEAHRFALHCSALAVHLLFVVTAPRRLGLRSGAPEQKDLRKNNSHTARRASQHTSHTSCPTS